MATGSLLGGAGAGAMSMLCVEARLKFIPHGNFLEVQMECQRKKELRGEQETAQRGDCPNPVL